VRKACSNYLTPDKLSETGEQKMKLSVGLHTGLQIGQPRVCNNRYNCYYVGILRGYSVSTLLVFYTCTFSTYCLYHPVRLIHVFSLNILKCFSVLKP